jgi:hypothetical protein
MTTVDDARARARAATLAVAAGFAALGSVASAQQEQPVRGWLEHAQIGGLSLDAKLDTGARTSSIHAEILHGPDLNALASVDAEPTVESEQAAEPDAPATVGGLDVEVIEDESQPEFEEIEVADAGGDETIVFRITNEQGETSTLQRTIVRYVEIKNRDGTTQRRPVVEIAACVAGVPVIGEVNLADREDFNYPFLVGRNMLEAAGIVVDAREIYTRSARCDSTGQ